MRYNAYTLASILKWVEEKNKNIKVELSPVGLSACKGWHYDQDTGMINHKSGGFFSVAGIQVKQENKKIYQPIILQPEVGFLGILCKKINGTYHFLMQAKIEPGNVNKIQISPTIQATKSNFTQKHGGRKPLYLEYFLNADQYKILSDQLQSEQASRFLGKRNRNMIVDVGEEEIPVFPSHRWMTLPQIKQLMRIDNLVNMDTRTVLSGLPLEEMVRSEEDWISIFGKVPDESFINSLFPKNYQFPIHVVHAMNDGKMFSDVEKKIIPLSEIKGWTMNDREIVCDYPYPFKVIFCDISMEGREVYNWGQPLFAATAHAFFGLLCTRQNGVLKFLVKITPEFGNFDTLELGPTIQKEGVPIEETEEDWVQQYFFKALQEGQHVLYDHMLSEEGGRFFCEQNRNVIIECEEEWKELPKGYFWLTLADVQQFVRFPHMMNIQLRNMLTLWEV